jgi:hypothetical protein
MERLSKRTEQLAMVSAHVEQTSGVNSSNRYKQALDRFQLKGRGFLGVSGLPLPGGSLVKNEDKDDMEGYPVQSGEVYGV